MQTFAAIDIGSNSCRLKIGRVVQHKLRIVHEDREVTRLGASVFESGIVSPEAMAATLRTLKRFYKAVQSNGTDKVRAVATSAMRDARNSRAFQAWVRDETGWDVEIISGLEEARLIHRGVVENEPGAGGRCVLVDIGGGSCEITLSEHKRIHRDDQLAAGRGAADAGIPAQRCAGEGRDPAAAAIYRPRAEEGEAADSSGPRASGDWDFRNGGGALRGRPGIG
jgi:exopolyphosphatase/pppGpp-phosphohydrolase